jgi:hypothetical protein
MFLFESAPWYSWLMLLGVIAALMLLNEFSRLNKWTALICFVLLPLALTIFVWPTTAGAGSSTGTWFHWAKVYSALAGCLGFLLIRMNKKVEASKFAIIFPPLILSINILEACVRDFQCFSLNGVVDGVVMIGGPWNIMNGIAGIINILTITGFMGIYVSRDKKRDMMWPDMLWFWIIAYDLWNFAYVYNCVSDHSFYAGAALLIAPTMTAFFIKKGAWLEHRAHTLAFWMMFTMAYPTFVDQSMFAVKASHNPAALFTVSALALASNIAVLVYYVYRIRKYKLNPLKQELYTNLKVYQKVSKSETEVSI